MANDADLVATTIEWTDGPADSVSVRGTFSDRVDEWWQETIPLQPTDMGFSATLRLRPGEYQFKFVVNGGEWRISSTRYATSDDGRGNINNIINVPDDAVLSIDDGRGAREASETTLGREYQQVTFCACQLLGTRTGKAPDVGTQVLRDHSAGAAPPQGDEGDGAGSRLRRYLIGAIVVLLFVLLGAGSALLDSV
ncbi:galactose metabolism- protein [Coemansia sp. RSA 2706]|nr:galactose metabolism- protein [Coemansia sp. RSA 2706]KAJ2322266.1 galactose metabolism- protein [Coemansia sp. RSA 2704]